MLNPPLPVDESARLQALRELDLLDTEPEEVFDTITRLASSLLGTPIAALTLIDAERQFNKSRLGVEATQMPRELAFCPHAIVRHEPMLVEDARLDSRFADNPLVTGETQVRAYAGVPLRTTEGHAIGALCVLDCVPRQFDDREVKMLADLARLATHEIHLREAAARARRIAADSLAAVQRSEGLYHALFDHAAIGIAIIGLDGQWLRVNPMMCRILDRSMQSLAQLTFQDLTHPDDLDADLNLVCQLVAGQIDHYTMQKRYLRPDASIVWAGLTVTLIRDAEGKPLHFVSIVEDISARRASDEALAEMREHLSDLVAARTHELAQAHTRMEDLYQHAPCGYYSLDSRGIFVQINEASLRLFGASRETMLGKRKPSEFLCDEGKRRFAQAFPVFMRDGQFGPEEFDLRGDDGIWRRVSVQATALYDAQRRFLHSRTVIFDVTELHRTRHALQSANRQQHLMLDNDLFAIIKVRNREFVWVNRAFETLVGRSADSLIGKPTHIMYPSRDEHARIGTESLALHGVGHAYRTEVQLLRRDGQLLWVDLNGSLLSEQTGEWLWIMRDISAIKQRRDEVESLAYHDALTGLPNRLLLMNRLSQALADAQQAGRHVVVAFVDLNGFKQINDVYGHEAGDQLLREVAARLSGSMRSHDTVARLGGDEFVIVLNGLASSDAVEPILARIHQIVCQPIRLSDAAEVVVTASLGVAVAPSDGSDGPTLIARADEAMYRVKRKLKLATHRD